MTRIPPPPPIMDALADEAALREITGRRLAYTETHVLLVDPDTEEVTPVRIEGRSVPRTIRGLLDRLRRVAAGAVGAEA